MYMGEHTNVTEELHVIQKQGRTKGSLLDHIAIPLTAFFMATDLVTIQLYTKSLFNEQSKMAMLVAVTTAALLDIAPMLAGKLKGQLDDMLPRDQRATRFRIRMLLGAAVGAYVLFAGFGAVSTLMSVETMQKKENTTLYMAAQIFRMLLPIATSVGSYAVGFFSDHRRQLEDLKAQRLDLQDLAADTDSAISHAEFAAANFDPDLQDYRFAQAKLKSLSIAARQARLTARMKLADELGSLEAAEALLHAAGLDDLLDEQHWQAMLLPPPRLRLHRNNRCSALRQSLPQRKCLPQWHPDPKQTFFRKKLPVFPTEKAGSAFSEV